MRETAAEGLIFFPKGSGRQNLLEGPGPPDAFKKFSQGGKDSPHGIGMHPSPKGPATLTYRIDRKHLKFAGSVSQNDGLPKCGGQMTFAIYGDGRLLWKSKPVASPKDAQEFSVDVSEVRELRLELSCGGEPRAAHGLWFEPKLE